MCRLFIMTNKLTPPYLVVNLENQLFPHTNQQQLKNVRCTFYEVGRLQFNHFDFF